MRTLELVCRGYGSDLTTSLPVPLHVKEASIGVKNFATYNTIANIEKDVNDSVKIRVPHSGEWKMFKFDVGTWSLATILDTLYAWIAHEWPEQADVQEEFLITGNMATSKIIIQFKSELILTSLAVCAACWGLKKPTNSKVVGFGRQKKYVILHDRRNYYFVVVSSKDHAIMENKFLYCSTA